MAKDPLFEFNDLQSFYPIYTHEGEIRALLNNDSEAAHSIPDFIRKLLEANTAAPPAADVAKKVNENVASSDEATNKTAKDTVRTVSNKAENVVSFSGEKQLEMHFDPSEDQALADRIHSILLLDHRTGPSLVGAREFKLFMNSIPNVEISKCQPYIDVRVQNVGKPEDAVKNLARMTSLKFLEAPISDNGKLGSADKALYDVASQGGVRSQGAKIDFKDGSFSSGMEMFTSPQTLVNADAHRVGPTTGFGIVDRNQPFMSIESLKINGQAVGTRERLYTEWGELNLVLHDRSRFLELGDIVAVKEGIAPLLLITFGWIHPDGPEADNPYADLINLLRRTDVFIISNFQIALMNTGAMKINLKIADISQKALSRLRISDAILPGQHIISSHIDALLRKFTADLKTSQSKEALASITAEQLLETTGDFEKRPQIIKALTPLVDKYLKGVNIDKKDLTHIWTNIASSEDLEEFLSILKELYNSDSSAGKLTEIDKSRTTVADVVRQKFWNLREPLDDPRRDPFHPAETKREDLKPHPRYGKVLEGLEYRLSGQHVSLGKILQNFLGPALVASPWVNEVQFMYYTFSQGCQDASGRNISSFMFDSDELIQHFQSKAKKMGTVNWTLWEFLNFISAELKDPSHDFYNMIPEQPTVTDENDLAVQSKKEIQTKAEGQTALETTATDHLKKKEAKTSIPDIQFRIYSRPLVRHSNSSARDVIGQSVVLRIDAFDMNDTAHQGVHALLQAAIQNDLENIKDAKTNVDIIKRALKSDLIRIDGDGHVRLNSDGVMIKQFLKTVVPEVTYGANNSMIIDAGLKTIADASLRTMRIQDIMRSGVTQPIGSGEVGLSLKVQAAQLDTRIMGFPILSPCMEIFWDFNTNTDIDQVYRAIKYTHELEKGKFQTQIEWQPGGQIAVYVDVFRKVQKAITELEMLKKES